MHSPVSTVCLSRPKFCFYLLQTAPVTPTSANKTAEKTPTSTADATASPATSSSSGAASTPQTTGAGPGASQSDPGAIRATAQMWRCSKIMHLLRDLHPTLLSALEGVVDQVGPSFLSYFPPCSVLRHLIPQACSLAILSHAPCSTLHVPCSWSSAPPGVKAR